MGIGAPSPWHGTGPTRTGPGFRPRTCRLESSVFAYGPVSTSDCKRGGWQELAADTGTPLKNQGDCVSCATGDSNPLNG